MSWCKNEKKAPYCNLDVYKLYKVWGNSGEKVFDRENRMEVDYFVIYFSKPTDEKRFSYRVPFIEYKIFRQKNNEIFDYKQMKEDVLFLMENDKAEK